MSAAANNWLKDRPLVTVLLSFVGSLVLAFTVRAANINREEQKILEAKIEDLASIRYVDQTMINHEAKEQIMFNNIEVLFKTWMEGQQNIIDRIDKRLDRIENKID